MQRRNKTQPSNRRTTIFAWLTAMHITHVWPFAHPQPVETLTAAQHYRSRHEHQILQSQLNLVVGTKITQCLGVRKE